MTNYVGEGLAEFAEPPYAFKHVISATFILKTEDDKPYLQNVCDKFLNGPLNRTQATDKIVPANNKVILTCSAFPMSTAPKLPIGYTRYREMAFMFSVYDRKHDEWSWYVPGLYLDGPAGGLEEWQPSLPISIGRELYGLSKRRAEIEFDTTDYTGYLETIKLTAPNTPIDVGKVLEIFLISSLSASRLSVELAEAEYALLRDCRPSKQKARRPFEVVNPFSIHGNEQIEELRAARIDAQRHDCHSRRELAALAAEPSEFRKRYTPDELLLMIWSKDPYFDVKPREEVVPPPTKEALFAKLGLVLDPSRHHRQFDFHLLGLRQLHNPQNFKLATTQQVVRTEISFDRLPWSPLQLYRFEIEPISDIAKLLGLKSQDLLQNQVWAYQDAVADFGKQVEIVS